MRFLSSWPAAMGLEDLYVFATVALGKLRCILAPPSDTLLFAFKPKPLIWWGANSIVSCFFEKWSRLRSIALIFSKSTLASGPAISSFYPCSSLPILMFLVLPLRPSPTLSSITSYSSPLESDTVPEYVISLRSESRPLPLCPGMTGPFPLDLEGSDIKKAPANWSAVKPILRLGRSDSCMFVIVL